MTTTQHPLPTKGVNVLESFHQHKHYLTSVSTVMDGTPFMILSTFTCRDGSKLHSYLGAGSTMYPAQCGDAISPLCQDIEAATRRLEVIRRYYPDARIVAYLDVVTPNGLLKLA